jgi:hypothetical protein
MHLGGLRSDIESLRVTAYPLVPYISYGPGTKLTGGKVVSNCLLLEKYKGKQG